MVTIDNNKVTRLFAELCSLGADEADRFEDMIDNAVVYVQERVIPEMVSDTDMKKLELAAAAVAAYDYTVIRLSGSSVLCTADGKAVSRVDSSDSYKYAKIMRDNALASLSGICSREGFVFAGVES